jgi:hypothetical protein
VRTVVATLIVVALAASACSDTTESTSTLAPTTTTTAAAATTTSEAEATPDLVPVTAGADADVDAIAEVYTVVFDSTTTYQEKAPFIVEPDGLESTVEQYTAAGDSVGGILLDVTAVGIADDTAAVQYDLLFAGSPFQQHQLGDAVRTAAGWQVTREFFCSIMELARVPCS